MNELLRLAYLVGAFAELFISMFLLLALISGMVGVLREGGPSPGDIVVGALVLAAVVVFFLLFLWGLGSSWNVFTAATLPHHFLELGQNV